MSCKLELKLNHSVSLKIQRLKRDKKKLNGERKLT